MGADAFATETVRAAAGMVASANHLATAAGVALLRAGGTAADAAVATGAVLAVTEQHQCGLGGDLFALVHEPGARPTALCAAGRAGEGADAIQLRAEGHERMPFQDDVRSVTVPGCVDGWLALHRRYGRLPLAQVLDPAITYAAAGFPVSPILAAIAGDILHVPGAEDYREPAMAAGGRLQAGTHVRRPGVADALEAIVAHGRGGFYQGVFGEGLLRLGLGLFSRGDLARDQSAWVEPLQVRAWHHDVWTTPPPSQGYLTLGGAWVAGELGPPDPDDAAWPHLLSEAARHVGADRDAVLHEGADGAALVDVGRLAERWAAVDPERRSDVAPLAAGGGTTAASVVDRERMAVSLIQSNASAWGARLAEPDTGVFLHNRGIGFSLVAGHPAEYAPGRCPPHTLAPALVTRPDGRLRAVLGTMGGDSQPQVLLQLLARLLHHGQEPGAALDGARWVLTGAGPFRTWEGDGPGGIAVEVHAPEGWDEGLRARGHDVTRSRHRIAHGFGHAQVVEVDGDGGLRGAADARALTGAALGH
ncbi:MAG TPA: gamma-glutamyltransferase [Acidimicrobiales bacterium]